MYYLLILSFVSHVACDFYFQTSNMVKYKNIKNCKKLSFYTYHVIHGLTHYIGFIIAYCLFLYNTNNNLQEYILAGMFYGTIILVSHIAIDTMKEIVNRKTTNKELHWFVLDQLLHALVIIITIILINKYGRLHISKNEIDKITPLIQISLIAFGVLSLLKPTSLFVIKFLDMSMCDGKIKHISITKSHVSKLFDENLNKGLSDFVLQKDLINLNVDEKLELYIKNTNIIKTSLKSKIDTLSVDVESVFTTNNGGKWIGYIERLMIFTFYLLGQFTAIAAVMAIKTAFRFNDLKDDNDSQRSEYIMLGTFSSLFITILTAVIIKYFITVPHFASLIHGFRIVFG